MITIELTVDYPDGIVADAVLNALGPDNIGYVESELEGRTLRFRCSSESAGTLRNTIDDLLACLKVAEESIDIAFSR